MPDLPKKKVGIVACSGEERPEGTVTRLAALKVLEDLRPDETVTICLPLFLAGGEGDRAFARFYPTVALDGCELRCAARATEMHSGKPAASIVVTDLLAENGFEEPRGLRRLDAAGMELVDATAERVAGLVDELLGKRWSRREGILFEESPVVSEPVSAPAPQPAKEESTVAACACGSGIPVQKVTINGRSVSLIALPLIFEQFCQAGKMPQDGVTHELLEMVKIYNPIPEGEEDRYAEVLFREYETYCATREKTA